MYNKKREIRTVHNNKYSVCTSYINAKNVSGMIYKATSAIFMFQSVIIE